MTVPQGGLTDPLTQMNTYQSYVTMIGDPGAKDENKLHAAQELSENFEVRNLVTIANVYEGNLVNTNFNLCTNLNNLIVWANLINLHTPHSKPAYIILKIGWFNESLTYPLSSDHNDKYLINLLIS